jgi:hypothetical protein
MICLNKIRIVILKEAGTTLLQGDLSNMGLFSDMELNKRVFMIDSKIEKKIIGKNLKKYYKKLKCKQLSKKKDKMFIF